MSADRIEHDKTWLSDLEAQTRCPAYARRIAELERENARLREEAGIQCDKHYVLGMDAGWSYCISQYPPRDGDHPGNPERSAAFAAAKEQRLAQIRQAQEATARAREED